MWPRRAQHPTVGIQELHETYDYIIVGGGTAGCVLANRLSEDKDITVLVIEKGEPAFNWSSRVPLLSSNFQSDGSRSLTIPSEPQVHVGGRTMEVVMGKALGGTSRINGLLYTRGLPAEYNAWSDSGRKGWSYDDLLPYFLKSERALDQERLDNHNSSGEWRNRSHSERFFATANSAIQAASKLGFPFIEDINSSAYPVVGITKLHYTIDEHSRRSDTASAFLPVDLLKRRRSCLHLCTGAVATRLNVSSASDGAVSVTGVHIRGEENEYKSSRLVEAKREVIVCAGSIGTPQLLMLSGIGPREHLTAHGIHVHKDLPGVGSNLDHIGVPILYNIPMNDSLLAIQHKSWIALREFFKYTWAGKGLFLCSPHELSLFARSDLLSAQFHHEVDDPSRVDGRIPANTPDIEIMTIAWGKTDEKTKSLGGFSLWAIPIRPSSLGTVRLRSSDPRDPPLCDPNLLATPEDRVTLHQAMRLCLHLKDEMAQDGYPIVEHSVPKSDDSAELDKHIDEWSQSIYHYTSTCRMGPEDDIKPGVVDDELRVHGIRGLRIADSSIFPNILATHLQAATVVVAEKCGDMVKALRQA